ncbi:MAG: ComF family protein, partial [Caldimonas sp.]
MLATRGMRAAAPWRWPSLCAVCRGWGAGRVCAECLARFAPLVPRCRRCALPVPGGVAVCGACLAAPPPFDAAFARVDYAFPWDRLIPAFKFHAALDLAPVLAEAIVEACAGRDGGAAAPLVVPVPLSEARLRERGCSQAWELARRAARRLGCAADAGLLVRIRDTPHQLDLPPAERAGNARRVRGRAAPARRSQGADDRRGRRRDDGRQHRCRDRAGPEGRRLRAGRGLGRGAYAATRGRCLASTGPSRHV